MPETYQDRYSISFRRLHDMMDYHVNQSIHSRWERAATNDLHIEPLDEYCSLYGDYSAFEASVTEGAVKDTANNLGLALLYGSDCYPMRDTAYKSLLDRARIGGAALLKLKRSNLADILNLCLPLYKDMALLLIREQKVTAVHSGDAKDYCVLPIDGLLESLKNTLDDRFPGNAFESGYSDHTLTHAGWSLPDHKDELLGTYRKTLENSGKSALASKLMPGIRFSTSDTGNSSAKASALILGLPYPIPIGGTVATEHRGQANIQSFKESLPMLFAQFTDSVARLEKLTAIYLDYPVNAMTAICKKLSMPKSASLEAIGMYEMACGEKTATAHDVFIAMQEIMFICKTANTPESKMLLLEENMARALTLNWVNFDTAKAVTW